MNYIDTLRRKNPALNDFTDDAIIQALPEYSPGIFGNKSPDEVRAMAYQDNHALADLGRAAWSGVQSAAGHTVKGLEQWVGADWQLDDSLLQAGERTMSRADPRFQEQIASAGFREDSDNTVMGLLGAGVQGLSSVAIFAPVMAASAIAAPLTGGTSIPVGIGIVGGGVVNALMIGGASYDETLESIRALDDEDLADSPLFAAYLEDEESRGESGAFERAKDRMAHDLASDAHKAGSAIGGVSGMLVGPMLNRVISGGRGVIRGAGQGAVTEGIQEVGESGGEALTREIALSEATGRPVDYDLAARDAAFGLVIGAGGGAAVGTGAGLLTPRREVRPDPRKEAGDAIQQAEQDARDRGGDELDAAIAGAHVAIDAIPEAARQQRQLQAIWGEPVAAPERDITAADLGLQLPPESGVQPRARERIPFDQPRDMGGIDGLITIARRLGFEEEVVALNLVKQHYAAAERLAAEGNAEAAARRRERGDALYREITEGQDKPMAEYANQFPVPYEHQGEVVGGEVATRDAGFTFGREDIDGTAIEVPTNRLEDQSQGRIGHEGMIYGQAPEVDQQPNLHEGVGRNVVDRMAQRPIGIEATPGVEARQLRAADLRPESVWAGSRGDGYPSEQAARVGVQMRQKAVPQLDWQVEQMPSGRWQLAGYPQATAARPDLRGDPVDNEWTAFSRESGTLGVPRADMPQIKSGDRSAMVQFLRARGIDYRKETVPAASLKPTQAEFSESKTGQARDYEGGDRSILVSSDGHILDGHHQWLARADSGSDVGVIRLDAPIAALLSEVAAFPSVEAAPESAAEPSALQKSAQTPQPAPDLQGDSIAGDGAVSTTAPQASLEAKKAAQPMPVLQNRNRATVASIEQMTGIAANPDYFRLSPSRDFANGAPVVEPGAPVVATGKSDTAVTASGRRIPVQYAAVEADTLLPSHSVDGTANAGYAAGEQGKSRAIAGNGRVAGLQSAFQQNTAAQYVEDMASDDMHGIDPDAIRGMRNPVLVRVMPSEEVTDTIGDESNTTGTAQLSPSEQARNDSRRVQAGGVTLNEDGEVTPQAAAQFVATMPQSEKANLMDGKEPNRTAYDRLQNLIFFDAYESDTLLRLQAEAVDPEVRTIMAGLRIAAGRMARLKGMGEYDIRGLVVEAAEVAVNAKRSRQPLSQFIEQSDISRNPEIQAILEVMANNIRSAKRIGEQLSYLADTFYNEASRPDVDMFGDTMKRPRQELMEEVYGTAEGATQDEATAGQQSRAAGDEGGDGRQAVPPIEGGAGPTEGQAEAVASAEPAVEKAPPGAVFRSGEEKPALEGELALAQETESERQARERNDRDAIERAAKLRKAEADKAKSEADEKATRQAADTSVDRFELGQSAEQQLSGQNDLLGEAEALYSGYEREASDIQSRERDQGVSEPEADAVGRGGQLDLFAPPEADKRQAYADLFGTIVKPRPVDRISSATDTIAEEADLAHLLASIRKDPQEVFYAVATDKDGKVLRVMRFTRGTKDAASVYALDVIAEAASIDGIDSLHFAHNHPSGSTSPSAADTAITDRIQSMLDGTGIAPGYHVVIGGGTWGSVRSDAGRSGGPGGRLQPRARTKTIPITERRITRRGTLGEAITSPMSAKRLTDSHDNAIFLLDTQHRPVAIIPMSPAEMGALREGGRVSRILSAINTSSASAAIVKSESRGAADNVTRMLSTYEGELRVLDALYPDGSGAVVSAANSGRVETSGPWFSRGREPVTNPHTADTLKAALDQAFPGVYGALEKAGLARTIARDQLPEGVASDARAYVQDGVVTFVADNIPKNHNVKGLMLHEIGVHLHQMGQGDTEFQKILERFEQMRKMGGKKIVAAFDRVPKETPAHLVAEEALGYMLETHPDNAISKRLVAWVKAKLREWLGPVKGSERLAVMRWANTLSEADLIHMATAAVRDVREAAGRAGDTVMASRAGRLGSDRTSWGDFPDVVFMAQLGAIKDHPRYAEAKAGDVDAAAEVVQSVLSDEVIESIRDQLGESRPIVVPVTAEESAGRNKIPLAYAHAIASRLGLDVDTEVVQSVRAKHTDSGAFHRIGVQPVFDGEVVPGQDYLVVDDTMTMGGTLANLRGHIEANGGRVVLASTLTGFPSAAKIKITEKMKSSLLAKHGQALDDYLQTEFGFGIDSLTQGEAGHLRAAPSLDSIRDRIAEARRAAGVSPSGEDQVLSPGDIRYSRTADAFTDLDDDQSAFLNKTGRPPATKRARDWLAERLDRAGTKIRQGMVDRYAALKEMDEKLHGKDFIDTAIHDSSWVLAKMSSAGSGALTAMMTAGRIRYNTKERVITLKDDDASGGLTAVLSQVGSSAEVERFMGWIAANRAGRLLAEGRENLFTPKEIAAGKRLNEGKTEDGRARSMVYAKAFAQFQQYRDDVLAIAEATGIISAENRAMWKDEFYVPFYRVMAEDAAAKGPGGSKGLSRQEAYKRLKGGKENLNDLLENTLMNFHHLLSASLKNQAAVQSVKNAEKLGIAKKVPEIARDPKTSTFVLEDGEKVFYEISDPLVYEAITILADPGLNNFAVRSMGAFKRLLTQMVTITPQFIAANTLRDLMQATATTPTSKNVFKNFGQGIGAYRDAKTRAQMLASGGAFSFGHIYGMEASEVRASLNRTIKGAKLVSDRNMVPGIIKAGWKAWGEVTDTSENVTRAATYVQNVEEMGQLRAAFEARDIMDFSQHGAWPAIRFLIRVVPFLNARLQGLDKIYRSGFKPALLVAMGQGTASDKQAAGRFAAVTGALTLASLALYMANKDDEEYQKLEEWQKDTYWFFRIGDHAFFLPKSFETGAIATLAERIAQQFMDDKATGELFRERLGAMLMETFSFNPVPQMFQPALDVYANRDSFTGRPIETAGMERLSPGLRARDTTTAPARALSAVSRLAGDDSPVALSPVQADHLISGYLGSVGASAAGMIDTIWRTASNQPAPDKRWYEWQPIRRFYRDLGAPAPYTRYSSLFYDGLREANRVYADVMELQKLGREKRALELVEENRGVLVLRQTLSRQQRQLTEINQRMQIVRRSDWDGARKRQELDRLMVIRNQITEQMGRMVEDARVAR